MASVKGRTKVVNAWPTEAEVEGWLGAASIALVVWFFWLVRLK